MCVGVDVKQGEKVGGNFINHLARIGREGREKWHFYIEQVTIIRENVTGKGK